VVESQIDNLTFGRFFCHNLCFKYSNGSCEPILDIYVVRAFQWYKKFFNPMGLDFYNRPLKIQKSIETSIPKVGAHFTVWRFIPSHSPTFPRTWNVTPELHSWLATLQALVLVTSPRLRLRQNDHAYWINKLPTLSINPPTNANPTDGQFSCKNNITWM